MGSIQDHKRAALGGRRSLADEESAFWARMEEGMFSMPSVMDPFYGTVGDGVTNDYSAIQALLDDVAADGGGSVWVPIGTYGIYTSAGQPGLVIPGGVSLVGPRLIDYAQTNAAIANGAIFKALGAMESVVQVGNGADPPVFPAGYVSGVTGPQLVGVNVDGMNLTTAAVKIIGARAIVADCQIWRALTQALWQRGQNGYVRNCVIGQDNRGIGVLMAGNDNKLHGGQVRGATVARVKITHQECEVVGVHMFPNQDGPGGNDILIQGGADSGSLVLGSWIEGNVIGADIQTGSHVYLTGHTKDITIINNHLYILSTPGTPVSGIYNDGTSTVLKVSGNKIYGAATTYSAIVNNVGTITRGHITDNQAENCAAILTGFTPSIRGLNGAWDGVSVLVDP